MMNQRTLTDAGYRQLRARMKLLGCFACSKQVVNHGRNRPEYGCSDPHGPDPDPETFRCRRLRPK